MRHGEFKANKKISMHCLKETQRVTAQILIYMDDNGVNLTTAMYRVED